MERSFVVRFHAIDRAGIVYFARIYEYCHVTYEDLLEGLVGNLEAFFQRSSWMMPLVRSEADYRRPLRLGDRIVVRLEVERLGERSITFAYTIRGEEDGEERARTRLTHVFVDRESFRSRPAPDEVREGLARLGLWPREPAH